MDAYCINCSISYFVPLSIDVTLKACELKELESVSVLLATVQRFEQDACILTIVGSFLNCSVVTSNVHLEQASFDEGTLEGTRQLIRILLELEHSRG